MCKYCDGNRVDYSWVTKKINAGDFGNLNLHVSVSALWNALVIECAEEQRDPFYTETVRITYCPFCGRRLKKEDGNGKNDH